MKKVSSNPQSTFAVGKFSDHQLKKMVPKSKINVLKKGFVDLNSNEFIVEVKESVCNTLIDDLGKSFMQRLLRSSD